MTPQEIQDKIEAAAAAVREFGEAIRPHREGIAALEEAECKAAYLAGRRAYPEVLNEHSTDVAPAPEWVGMPILG